MTHLCVYTFASRSFLFSELDKLEVIGMSRDLFMASPYETMRTILATIVEDYGDVESFLDSVGLSFEEQRNIRCRLLKT